MTTETNSDLKIVALYVLVKKLYWVREQHSDDHYQLFTKQEINNMYGVQHTKGTLLCQIYDQDGEYETDTLYGFDAETKLPNDDVTLGLAWCIQNNLAVIVPQQMTTQILTQPLQLLKTIPETKDTKYLYFINVLPVKQKRVKKDTLALVLYDDGAHKKCICTKDKLYVHQEELSR